MGDFDLNEMTDGVGKPEFELPKRAEPEPIPGPELHRLTMIHVKYSATPKRRCVLLNHWVQFYAQFEDTSWVTEKLYLSVRVWAKLSKLRWGVGTFNLWLEEEYAGWAKKQEGVAAMDIKEEAAYRYAQQEKVAKEASKAADKALRDEFHTLPDYEQKKYREDTVEIMVGRFPVLPPADVVETNAAKLWKRKMKG